MLATLALEPQQPLGSFLLAGDAGGNLADAQEHDQFTFDVSAGQMISVVVMTDAQMQAALELTTPGEGTHSHTASAAGQSAFLTTIEATETGTYTLDVSSLTDGGEYGVHVYINADFERESIELTSNDTLETAQDFSPSRTSPHQNYSREAVAGNFGPDWDYYRVSMSEGELASFTLTQTEVTGQAPRFEVHSASGQLMAHSEQRRLAGVDAVIQRFAAPEDGDYFVRVQGSAGTVYHLSVTRSAMFGLEPDGPLESPQKLLPYLKSAVGHLGGPGTEPVRVAVLDDSTFNLSSRLINSSQGLIRPYNVTAAEIDTAGELAFYDVVVIGNNVGDASVYDQIGPALAAYVNAGGGLVSLGGTLSSLVDAGASAIDALDPVIPVDVTDSLDDIAAHFFEFVTVVGPAHPVTENLPSSFYGGVTMEAALAGIDAGATTLGETFEQPVLVVGSAGSGRTVYFGANLESDSSIPFYVGQAFEQAVLWARRAAPPTDVVDQYMIGALSGDVITARVTTTGGDLVTKVELVNMAGVVLEVDENLDGDGIAEFAHNLVEDFDFFVRVTRVSGSGEYHVQTDGWGLVGGPHVTFAQFTNVAGDQPYPTYPKKIQLYFSEALRFTSVTPDDLTVNGVAARGVSVISPWAVEFDIENTAARTGEFEIVLANDSVEAVYGQTGSGFSQTFTVDAQGPYVTAATLVPNTDFDLTNDFSFSVEFSEPLLTLLDDGGGGLIEVLDRFDVEAFNIDTQNTYYASTFEYNEDETPRIDASFENLPPGEYRLRLVSGSYLTSSLAFQDVDGHPLDGSPSFPLPSGDGAYDDPFEIPFIVSFDPFSDGPAVTATSPGLGTTGQVTEITFDLSHPVVGDAARDPATYQLTDLGLNRTSSFDDWSIPVTPHYTDGETQVTLEIGASPLGIAAAGSLRGFRTLGYGSTSFWSVAGPSASVAPTVTVSDFSDIPSFFVSDYNWIGDAFTGSLLVNTTADDDMIGIVFGFQPNAANTQPDSYYILTWTQVGGTIAGVLGTAEQGLKLLRVQNTGKLTVTQMKAMLWDGEANANVSVLAANLGASAGWADQTEYDFSITPHASGQIDVSIVRRADSVVVWNTSVTDPSPLGTGQIGFFNYSQQSSTFRFAPTALPEGSYLLVAQSGETRLRDDLGRYLDGNNDGLGGDALQHRFVVDRTPPRVAAVALQTFGQGINVTFQDRGGMHPARVTDLANYRLFSSGGDNIFGNGNDVDVTSLISGASFNANSDVVTLSLTAALANEQYQLVIDGTSGITDKADHALVGGDFIGTFSVPTPMVSIDLSAAQDTGAFDSDNITSITTPALQVTVNTAGLIELDANGDGTFELNQAAGEAGAYGFSPAAYSDGRYVVKARFTPQFGVPVEATLPLVIDTTAPTVAPGLGGNSLRFSGTQWVEVPSKSIVNPTSGSIELWLFSTSLSGTRMLVHAGEAAADGDGPQKEFALSTSGSSLRFQYWSGPFAGWDFTGGFLSSNTWHHIAATWDSASGVRLYLDGQLVGQREYWSVDNAAWLDKVRIGASINSTLPFAGNIDDVRFWSAARTQTEIQRDTDRIFTGSEANLAAYYRFNEGTGTTTADLTSGARHGVLGGNGVAANQPAWNATDAQGATLFTTGTNVSLLYQDFAGIEPARATNLANYVLLSSGGDGVFGNGNDVVRTADLNTASFVAATQRLVLRRFTAWPDDVYQLRLAGAHGIADLAGNALANSDFTYTFSVANTVATVSLDLAAASDAGASATDNLTNVVTPTFNVIVNEAGRVELDFDGDGVIDLTQAVPGAGTYPFVSTVLAEGVRNARATLISTSNESVSSTLPVTIDTTGPTASAIHGRGALTFDGVDDFVQLPASPLFDLTSAVTMSAWIRPTVQQHNGLFPVILSRATNDGAREAWIFGIHNRKLYVKVNTTAGSFYRETTADYMQVGQWQHVAASYDQAAGKMALYFNGVLAEEFTGITGAMTGGTFAPSIGAMARTTAQHHFAGQMDEVQLWNVTLPAAEIAANYNKHRLGNEVGLVGYWRMDEAGGDRISDRTANALHGQLPAFRESIWPLRGRSLAPLVTSEPGAAAPLAWRAVRFSEAMDPATLTADDVVLARAGGAVVGPATGFNFVGNAATIHFAGFGPSLASESFQMTFGPNITDIAGNPLNQDGDATVGESGEDALIDAFNLNPDTQAPFVVDYGVKTVAGSLSKIRVVFSEWINQATLTPERITITGPAGVIPTASITITSVATTTEPALRDIFEINFPAQTTPGNYTLAIDALVADFAGNRLDQDRDGLFGEVTHDVFRATIALQSLTTVSGTISANTTWSGTVHVTGNLTLAAAATLTILPGTTIKVNQGTWLDFFGTVQAPGTAAAPIVFTTVNDDTAGGDLTGFAPGTPLAGHWDGLYFETSSSASVLENIEVRYAGNAVQPGHTSFFRNSIEIRNASPRLEHVLVRDANSTGIAITGGSPTLTDVRVERAGNVAFWQAVGASPIYSALSALSTAGNYVQHQSGTLSGNRTWSFGGLPMYLENDLFIAGGSQLTIAAGTIVKLPFGVHIEADGALIANGTAAQPVIFTAFADDTVGGDSNRDGGATLPVPGSWDALWIDNSASSLKHVEFRYGGNRAHPLHGSFRTTPVQVREGASPLLQNVLIRNSENQGLYLQSGSPRLENVRVETSGAEAIYQELAATPIYVNVTAQANAANRVTLNAGTIGDTRTWDFSGLPVYLTTDFRIATTGQLTIVPGTVVKFPFGGEFEVDGRLIAEGTPTQPIYFTAVSDDSVGGDTDGNGNTTPQRGSWDAMWIDSSNASLKHVEFRYGGNRAHPLHGSFRTTTVQVRGNVSPLLQNVRIMHSENQGLYLEGSSPTIDRVHIEGSGAEAIYQELNAHPVYTNVTARNNIGNRVTLAAGTITDTRTWDFSGLPVHLTNDFRLAPGSQLTIVPGTVIKLPNGGEFEIDGALIAEGSFAEPIVFTAYADDSVGGDSNADGSASLPLPGNWDAIWIDSSATTLKHVDVRYAGNRAHPQHGSFRTTAVQVRGNVSPLLQNVRILNSENQGLYLEGSSPTLDQVHIEGSGAEAIHQQLDAHPIYLGVTARNNAANRVTLYAGTMTDTRTWDFSGLPVYLTTDFRLAPGSQLTIVPGTVIKLPNGAEFEVDGALIAHGTPASPIIFTAITDDTAGGDANGDGAASSAAPGNWDAIWLDNSAASLKHVEVRYAGNRAHPLHGSFRTTAVQVREGASPLLQNVLIRNSENQGLYVTSGSPRLENLRIETSGAEAIYQELAATPVYVNVTAVANAANRVTVNAGTINDTRTWDFSGLPVYLTTDFRVGGAANLTIVPGTIIKLPNGAEFEIDGRLTAEGTLASPIIFTSINDDTAGGDSNGDGAASSAAPGSWDAIWIDSATAVLEHVDVRYAGNRAHPNHGSFRTSAVHVRNGINLTLDHLTVRHSENWAIQVYDNAALTLSNSLLTNSLLAGGIYVDDGSATVTATGIFNSLYGVWIDNGETATMSGSAFGNISTETVHHDGTVFANANFEGNWWGHVDGPHDPSAADGQSHPNPLGLLVDDFVDYDNFLGAPPALGVGPFVRSLKAIRVDGAITQLEVAFSDPIVAASFTADDVAITGPQAATVSLIETLSPQSFRLTLSAPLAAEGLYEFKIGPGILSPSGYALDQDQDGVGGEALHDVFSASFMVDRTGPHVTLQQPEGVVASSVASVEIEFSEPIAPTSFTTAKARLFNVAGNPVQILAVTPLSANRFRVDFAPQSVNGEYRVEVLPTITDLFGNLLDQDQDGVRGEATEDLYTGTFTIDRQSLRIIAQSPTGTLSTALASFDVTFNAAIEESSFGPGDIVLLGPSGQVAVSGVQKLSPTQYRITVPPQTGDGTYQLRIGPDITDLGGVRMDQDADGAPGEPEDRYFGEVAVAGVGPFIESHTPTITVAAPVRSIDVKFSEAISVATFSTLDVVLTGPQGAVPILQIEPLAAAGAFRIHIADLSADGLYTLRVGPFIGDIGGTQMDGDRDGVPAENDDAYTGTFTIDNTGPAVIAFDPPGTVTAPYSSVTIQFSEALDGSTFTTADVTIGGPSGAIPVSGIDSLPDNKYRIRFATQAAVGSYQFTIGPNVQDRVGNRMDKDGDRIFGEAGDGFAFSIAQALPDLIPASVQTPATIKNGEFLAASWLVKNIGGAATAAPFEGLIVLSLDQFFGNADDVVLGSAVTSAPLGVGGEATVTTSGRIPFGPTGNYRLFVRADRHNSIVEISETNNVVEVPITIEFAPPPADLRVEVVTAPAAAQTGQTIGVAWRVANAGTETTQIGAWYDRIYLSRDAVLGNADDVYFGDYFRHGALAASATYTVSVNVTLPVDLAEAGDYQIYVITDIQNHVQEPGAEANNIGTAVVNVSLAPTPDLTVLAFAAPVGGVVGETLALSWTVRNQGAAAAASWSDRVYLSTTGTLAGATLLGTFASTTPLAAGAESVRTGSVTLPSLGDGPYYIVVVTDALTQVYERGAEGNNVTASTQTFPLTHADLSIDSVDLSAGPYLSGQMVTASWVGRNSGTGAAPRVWSDRVYLSTDATLSAGDILLGSRTAAANLAPAATYNGSLAVRLPDGISGDYFILVQADGAGEIPEPGGEANNVTAKSLSATLSPYADLTVTAVVAPQLVIGDPVDLRVSWTVSNVGTGAGTVDRWTDRILLSVDTTIGNGDDIVLGNIEHVGLLPIGTSYTDERFFSLPPATQARFNLYVVTDTGTAANPAGVVYEHTNTGSNTGVLTPVDVTRKPYADLQVDAINPQLTAFNGQPLNVTWMVTNRGIGVTDQASWTDHIYLANDPAGQTGLVHIGSFTHAGNLQPGQSYEHSAEFTVPITAQGTRYVVVVGSSRVDLQACKLEYSIVSPK